jgi:hypothetical protein
VPIRLVSGTSPHWRLSELLKLLSPMAKYFRGWS